MPYHSECFNLSAKILLCSAPALAHKFCPNSELLTIFMMHGNTLFVFYVAHLKTFKWSASHKTGGIFLLKNGTD